MPNQDEYLQHQMNEQADREITVTLPIPPKEVRPNARAHWAAIMTAKRRMRQRSHAEAVLACGADPPEWYEASVRITWYHKTRRFLDRDNIIASCKAYIDGLQDAGVIIDDANMRYEPVVREKDEKNPRVELRVRKIG